MSIWRRIYNGGHDSDTVSKPSLKQNETEQNHSDNNHADCCWLLATISKLAHNWRMTPYLTPEQATALHAGGDAPMQIVDPTTQRVYYIVDGDLLAELKCHSDLEAIREGIADMRAGRSIPIEQARTEDRAQLLRRFAQ